MPITPFHGLALMFLHFKNRKGFDLLALMVSATFVDLEVLYYLLLGEPLDHRIWHGFLMSSTIYPILITIGVFTVEHLFEERLRSAYNAVRLEANQVQYSLQKIYICSLIGGVTHVFLDMLTHESMPYVFFPIYYGNPFYIGQASIIVEIAVILLAIYSCKQWLNMWKLQSSKGRC